MNDMANVRRLLGALATGLALIVGSTAPVTAQTNDRQVAAQVAFDKAKELFEAKKYDQACKLLEHSLELDPTMGTRFQLARCYEKIGRLASAWAKYIEVADAAKVAKMARREEAARSRAAEVKSRISHLTIAVPDTVARLPGLQIQHNGVPMGRALWGTAMPVDGGAQKVVATAKGYTSWSSEETVAAEGANVTVTIPMLSKVPESSPAPTAVPIAIPSATTEPEKPDQSPVDSTQEIVGVVMAGAGVLAMGASIVVGVMAKARYDDSEDHCIDNYCDTEGIEEGDGARAQGTAATVVFGIGAAALVGGLIVWLVAPDEPEPAAATEFGVRFSVAPSNEGSQLLLNGVW